MPTFDGLIPLRAAPAAVLKLASAEADPVARARTRYRLVWKAVAKQPDLAVRVGGRLFVLDQPAKLRQLAAALGVIEAAPKPTRAKRAPSNTAIAA
jgi:hypothetical protein